MGSTACYSYVTDEKALQEICLKITQVLLWTIMLDQHFSFLYISCSTTQPWLSTQKLQLPLDCDAEENDHTLSSLAGAGSHFFSLRTAIFTQPPKTHICWHSRVGKKQHAMQEKPIWSTHLSCFSVNCPTGKQHQEFEVSLLMWVWNSEWGWLLEISQISKGMSVLQVIVCAYTRLSHSPLSYCSICPGERRYRKNS